MRKVQGKYFPSPLISDQTPALFPCGSQLTVTVLHFPGCLWDLRGVKIATVAVFVVSGERPALYEKAARR